MTKLLVSCICSLALSTPGSAFPIATMKCAHSGESSTFGSLFKQVAFYTKSGTKMVPIDQFTKLSAAEKKQIRESTGYVFCPGPDGIHGKIASASLIGDNQHLSTAAHLFKDDETTKFKPGISKCIFKTQGKPQQEIQLDITDEGGPNFIGGENFSKADKTHDYAFVRLKRPVVGAKPIPVDLSGRSLWENDKIIMVSATQTGVDIPGYRDPLVQECTAHNVVGNATNAYLSDCDLMGKGSGSMQMIRSPSGQLVNKALAVRSGTNNDREDYDISKNQFSISLGIDGDALRDLRAAVPTLAVGHGAVE